MGDKPRVTDPADGHDSPAAATPARVFLEDLIEQGFFSDPETARRQFRVGYPMWLILGEELGRDRTVALLSEATGIPVLPGGLRSGLLDTEVAREFGPKVLKARRWAPLRDGSVTVADPFAPPPDGALALRPLRLAPAAEIDEVLKRELPSSGEDMKGLRRLGRLLVDEGVVDLEGLALALEEQKRSGGLLGEILMAQGAVDAPTLTRTLARKIGLPTVGPGEKSSSLLPARLARAWGAVALTPEEGTDGITRPLPVAFADPQAETVAAVEEYLGLAVEPRLVDRETLITLLAAVYAEADVKDVVDGLLQTTPHFSAFGSRLSPVQAVVGAVLLLAFVVGLFVNFFFTAVAATAASSLLYISYTLYRLFTAWQGWRAEATLRPSDEEIASLDERELPVYTLLLPVYKEKPATLRALFDALSRLDYPKHKLDGVLLVEADDDQTREAIEEVGKPAWFSALTVPKTPETEEAVEKVGRPGWLKVLPVPPGEPRTKPKAMIYGLLYARGDLITVYDAEDQPEPQQLKEAVWGFKHADDSVACLQAKLNYYNSRQNLLTRWFTLEYSAWFDMFLPGLHRLGAPIPLGGTSNHFRADVLKESLSWDPYNVTEDADLGLRFTRLGKTTRMLASTTYEEANSRFNNWLKQRSRWIKGYMQTFLVHTRDPVTLVREIGLKNTAYFAATVGGLIYTVLISPIFWALLVLWLLVQPAWIPELFPGAVYYLALINLFIGNFFFVFLGIIGAVGRGNDDLVPSTLLMPVYWLMMSVAGYMALYELITKPYYWQKTEHGLHFGEEPEASSA